MHKAILLLKKIPKGKVTTYKELARVCKTSPRAIGRIMAQNEYPKEYPCYKVVASDGSLQGYSAPGGLQTKENLHVVKVEIVVQHSLTGIFSRGTAPRCP